jgi:hypothetical protein
MDAAQRFEGLAVPMCANEAIGLRKRRRRLSPA